MTEDTVPAKRTPGIVLFVAILNFLSTAFFALLTILLIGVLIFGSGMGFYEYVTGRLAQYSPDLNIGFGLTFFFSLILSVTVAFSVFHLIIGVGLLRGKRIYWYLQIALCVIGLLGFPVGTVLNAVILVFFFQDATRNFFGV